jgi:hypothetical protein
LIGVTICAFIWKAIIAKQNVNSSFFITIND